LSGRRCHAGGAAPLVKHVEHVGFAEVDLDGATAWPLAIVALKVPVDSAEGDLQRDAVARPARNHVKRRTYDADQMSVVFPAKVGFYIAAVLSDVDVAALAGIF